MVSPEIQQLQDQQSLLTNALRSMLEGVWCGAPPSTQAFVSALDPNQSFTCNAPILSSDAPPPPLFNFDPNTPMARQQNDWTCSACALDWLLVGAHARGTDRERTVNEIGYPQNINPTYGLMDGSGTQLMRVLDSYEMDSSQSWLSYDSAWSIYAQSPGMMSGGAWYHWVGVRGTSDGNLWIANSAPGYMGVYDILSRADFNRLGPFSCIWLTP